MFLIKQTRWTRWFHIGIASAIMVTSSLSGADKKAETDVSALIAWVDVLNSVPGLKIVAETSVELFDGTTPHLLSRRTATSYYQGDRFFHEIKEEFMDAPSKAVLPRRLVVSFDGERWYLVQSDRYASVNEGKPPVHGYGMRYFEKPLCFRRSCPWCIPAKLG